MAIIITFVPVVDGTPRVKGNFAFNFRQSERNDTETDDVHCIIFNHYLREIPWKPEHKEFCFVSNWKNASSLVYR
jgi:hypothetical protein